MWRQEENIINASHYSTTDGSSAAPLTQLGSTVASAAPRDFYIPNSIFSRAHRLDGLVDSTVQTASSPQYSSSGRPEMTEALWKDRQPHQEAAPALEAFLMPHPSSAASPEVEMEAMSSSSISSHRLILQYREMVQRLQGQLKAQEGRVKFLEQKLEESSRQYTKLQLQQQRPPAEQSVPPSTSVELLRQRVAARDGEIKELQGRLSAYQSALREARLRKGDRSRDGATDEDVDTADFPTSLSTLLRECLCTADYLVKVFNAVEHCQYVGHLEDSPVACQRRRRECSIRCLQAAMRGSCSADILKADDEMLLRDSNAAGVAVEQRQVAVAVREELMYCESMAIRLASKLLLSIGDGGNNGDDDGVAPAKATEEAAGSAAGGPPRRSEVLRSGERSSSVRSVKEDSSVASQPMSCTTTSIPAASSRPQRHSSSRAQIGDCEVQ